MFIFRWIKHLFTLIGVITVIYWGVQYFNTDSPARKQLDQFQQSSVWQEGIKDIKTWVSEIFRGFSDDLNEDVTEADRRELDKLLKEELRRKDIERVKPMSKQEVANQKRDN